MKLMKTVKAVAPYIFPEGFNFKTAPYEAWIKCGGQIAEAHYPPRLLHGLVYRWELPTFWKNKKEARLRLVQPVSINFDTFPDYAMYEIIPFMWDTWEPFHDNIAEFFVRYKVKTAIFCASQTAEVMRRRFPDMNILTITEGVDISLYEEGKPLCERNIDLLEYGRQNKKVFHVNLPSQYFHLSSKKGIKLFSSDEEFRHNLCDAKITVAFPKHDTCPEETGFVETLTQRYWENMLSRVIMIGRVPQELLRLIGYNPVIEIEKGRETEQIIDILSHLEDYQQLVDKNRSIALKQGDWGERMHEIFEWLKHIGYVI